MKRGKFEKIPARRVGSKRSILTLILVAALLVATVGGTLAYVFTHSDPLTNVFNPSQVSCRVESDLSITNTSDVDAYIRATVVVNWMDGEGNVRATAPVYEITANSGWTLQDGIYYYTAEVAVGDKIVAPAAVTCTETAPAGYTLSVEVVAEAIQSTGMGATSVQDAWAKAQGNN